MRMEEAIMQDEGNRKGGIVFLKMYIRDKTHSIRT